MKPDLNLHGLSAELEQAIAGLKATSSLTQIGVITRVGDGVAWIYGLGNCGFNELVTITTEAGPVSAYVLSLGQDELGAVILGDDSLVKAGDSVGLTGRQLEVPVGPELLGRVVDPLGRPLDGLDPIKTEASAPMERPAPGVMARQSVNQPLLTGITAIDTMVPIGLGQRELIIGDRGTGKTAIAVDTMINQGRAGSGVVNIYVAIGQKTSKVAALVARLKQEGVMEQTIIVATSPADPAALLYLAPYAATAMGEHFRDNSRHALIIYDDLSKHAVAYRQLSLLLRRPPGREAYPGDVFYLHSRLLERSAKLNDDLGGGSLTALPIIETQAGDVGAYIPTNVISITDGQIYLETSLFYQGIRPAISVGLSVSRVGGAAQSKATKSVASSLRLELAQFRELAAFSQFGSDLDEDTQNRIARGRLLTEVLKQRQYQPVSQGEQVSALLAATSGAFDDLLTADVQPAVHTLLTSLKQHHQALMHKLDAGTKPSEAEVKTVLDTAKHVATTFVASEEKD